MFDWLRRLFKRKKETPFVSNDAKLKVLRRVIDEIFAPALKLDGKKIILLEKGAAPMGRHLHAWSYPADAYLEGPGDTSAISFKAESLQKLNIETLSKVLAHEMGHVKFDMDRIREGREGDEVRAIKTAELLLATCSEQISEVLKGVASGA